MKPEGEAAEGKDEQGGKGGRGRGGGREEICSVGGGWGQAVWGKQGGEGGVEETGRVLVQGGTDGVEVAEHYVHGGTDGWGGGCKEGGYMERQMVQKR